MMRLFLLVAVAGLLLASTAAYAGWATVYQSNFDSAPYSLGGTINAVDGWTTSVNGTQSVVKDDGTGNHYLSLQGKASNNTYRALPQAITSGHVRLTQSWAMTSTTDYTVTPAVAYSATNMGLDAQNMWTMLASGTNDASDPRTGMFNSTFNTTTQTGKILAWTGAWSQVGTFALGEKHTLMMDVNMDTKNYDVYVDNLSTPVLTNIGFYSGATVSSITHLHLRKRYNTGDFAVDNIKVEVSTVPEPSSMLALASGLFGMAGFAIRRRK